MKSEALALSGYSIGREIQIMNRSRSLIFCTATGLNEIVFIVVAILFNAKRE